MVRPSRGKRAGCDHVVTIEDDSSAGGGYQTLRSHRLIILIRTPHLKSIKPLITAVETICRSLNVQSKDDPPAEIIALIVVEAAKTDERNPDRLRNLVLRALRNAQAPKEGCCALAHNLL